jgi:phosphotransferase system  glucose/maltose/N-acetylglucosamine-specific IIC component
LPLVLLLAASRALSVFDVDRPAVAVIAVNPNAELSVRMRSFAATFGLTPAEMSVMEKIVGGNVLPAVAAQFGGINRQTDLIHQVSGHLAVCLRTNEF